MLSAAVRHVGYAAKLGLCTCKVDIPPLWGEKYVQLSLSKSVASPRLL